MTEGEVCLDHAKRAETQRQTQLGHASAAQKVPFKRKCDSWFQDEGRLATIEAEFRSHLGNVGAKLLNFPFNRKRATVLWLKLPSKPTFLLAIDRTLQNGSFSEAARHVAGNRLLNVE